MPPPQAPAGDNVRACGEIDHAAAILE